MKKTLIILWCVAVIAFWYVLYDFQKTDSYFSIEAYKTNMQKYLPDVMLGNDETISKWLSYWYKHKGNSVFYQDVLLTWVKAKGFIVLEWFWIDNKWHVFSQSTLLSGLDWNSVQLYPYNIYYIHDKNGYYFIHWERLEILQPEWSFRTFTWILHIQFARDDTYLYYYWKSISWVNPDEVSFFDDSPDYFIASWQVFWWTTIVSGADAVSFQVLSWSDWTIWYAKDKNHNYYLGKIVSK